MNVCYFSMVGVQSFPVSEGWGQLPPLPRGTSPPALDVDFRNIHPYILNYDEG